MTLYSLQKRRDFIHLQQKGDKWITSAFILQTKSRREICDFLQNKSQNLAGGYRVGFTVTRKIGSAVIRNRVRRRLREIVRLVFPLYAKPFQDYVLIARAPALRYNFDQLQKDLIWALKRIHFQDPGYKNAIL